MRYRAIQSHTGRFPVTLMCRTLAVSSSGYYAWAARPESRRSAENRRLVTEIRVIHAESRATYGSPRVHATLTARGQRVGANRVARLMRASHLRAKTVKRWRATTDSSHTLPVAANTLNRQFTIEHPNRVWAGDMTYIWTAEGWLYLAVVLDLYSRRVIAWGMGSRLTQDLVTAALTMAVEHRRPAGGVLHHTDRGSQYAATPYRELLARHGLTASMSRRGNCWDNAVVCDQAAGESCPLFPGKPKKLHWSTPDPAKATGSEAEIEAAFDDTFLMLKKRVEDLVKWVPPGGLGISRISGCAGLQNC